MDLDQLQMNVMAAFPPPEDVEGEAYSGDELVSKAILEISTDAVAVMKVFYDNRNSDKFSDTRRKKVMSKLYNLAVQCGILMYLGDIESMSNEDIKDFAETFSMDVQQDGMLSCMSIQSAVANFSMSYFDEEEIDYETYEQSMAEILAMVHVLAERVGHTFVDVLAKTY